VYRVVVGSADNDEPCPTAQTEHLIVVRRPLAEFLSGFDGRIDLLYLDGWPVGSPEYQQRHLEAYRLAREKFHERTIVLIGDTGRDRGGKARLVLPEALEDGFQVLLWGKLTLLGRFRAAEVRDTVARLGPPIPGEASFDEAIRLHQEEYLWEAEQLYRGILKHWPDHSGALHLLGVVLHQCGDHEGALRYIGRAIVKSPPKAVHFNNYGGALHALGRPVEALACFHHALQLWGDYPDAHANLGLAQQSLGKEDAALASYRRALELQPRHRDAQKRLADLLREQGKTEEAMGVYQKAIELEPRAPLHVGYGNLLLVAARHDLAAVQYEKALELDPDCAAAFFNLGSARQHLYQSEEAQRLFQRAAELSPHKPLWRLRRSAASPVLFRDMQQIDAWRAELDKSLDGWLASPPTVNRWNDLIEADAIPSMSFAYHGRNNRRLKEKFGRFYAQYFRDMPQPAGSGMRSRRRLGFVVTQSHEGIFLRCMRGIIEHLDREAFELLILCSGGIVETVRKGIHRDDLRFVPLSDSFRESVARIREVACDVIYYWEVGSDSRNYFLPYACLAPVQCTSHGSLITTGVPAVDYFISSELVETDAAQEHYSEKLWKSRTLLMNEGRLSPVPPASRDSFGLPEKRNLYLCFQNPLKFHPDFDPLLRGILEADRKATIALLAGTRGAAAAVLKERFKETIGPQADRIVFLPWLKFQDYCCLLALADVVLDPPHYTASSSAYDILSFSQPTVTLPGELAVGRMGRGFHHKMHTEELVARSPEEYVSTAVRVATDRDYRQYLRDRIRSASDAVFNDVEAVREHERFFAEAQPVDRHL
jgi:predicted O-linked N-acetylglucosamine transferase (SPINDLY family)